MRNLIQSIQLPTTNEYYHIFLTALIGGFMYGITSIQTFAQDLFYMITYFLLFIILILSIELGKRIYAGIKGYQITYQAFYDVLLFGILLTILTGLPLFIIGGSFIKPIQHMRIGHFPYVHKLQEMANIMMWGLIFGSLAIVLLAQIIHHAFLIPLIITIALTLVPVDFILNYIYNQHVLISDVYSQKVRKKKEFPFTAGSLLFYASWIKLTFIIVFMTILFISIFSLPTLFSLLLALLFACVAAGSVFYVYRV